MPTMLFLINKMILLLKNDENNFPIDYRYIVYLALIGFMFGYRLQLISVILSLLIMLLGMSIHKYKKIPLGYYLSISTLITIIFEPYISKLIELI